MKAFLVDEYEFWAGESAEEVKAAYLKDRNEEDNDPELFENFTELSEEDLDKFTVIDEDEKGEYGSEPSRTFREHIKKMMAEGKEFPCFFAATEW